MTTVKTNFSDIRPREATSLVEPGRYLLKIERADLVQKKKTGSDMLVVEVSILDCSTPSVIGSKLPAFFLEGVDANSFWARRRELAELLVACGIKTETGEFDTTDMEHKTVMAEIVMLPAKDGYAARNAIGQWMDAKLWVRPVTTSKTVQPGTAQQAASAPATTQAPAPAPAPAPIADDVELGDL